MRVIAGVAKGKKLKMPKGQSVRPTQDKVKGAIFNILGDRIIDARVLDLFSGSGALGIEALSRGAGTCVFVDKETKCVKENLAGVGFQARVIRGNVESVIKRLALEKEKFDIVLADPPYEHGIAINLLNWLKINDIVTGSSLIVIEHSRREALEGEKLKEKQYGDTVVSVYKL